MTMWMKALRDNEKLQSEFISVLRGPHRDLMGLSHEVYMYSCCLYHCMDLTCTLKNSAVAMQKARLTYRITLPK